MTTANDSVLITPGTGATVATHLAAAKEHQVMMLADVTGHIAGSKATWYVGTGNTANVAAARTTHLDLFNASGSGVIIRVWGIFIIPTLTAVTGVGMTWELIRTSAVGTGGTGVTPRKHDTANAALPAQVTARTKPTGGATTDATNPLTVFANSSSEETIAITSLASALNLVPNYYLAGWATQPLVMREGEGLKIDQTTNSAVGSTNHAVIFTTE